MLGALLYPLVAFLASDLFRCSGYSFVIIAASGSLLAVNLDSSHCKLSVLIDSQLLELGYEVGLSELVVLDVGKAMAVQLQVFFCDALEGILGVDLVGLLKRGTSQLLAQVVQSLLVGLDFVERVVLDSYQFVEHIEVASG